MTDIANRFPTSSNPDDSRVPSVFNRHRTADSAAGGEGGTSDVDHLARMSRHGSFEQVLGEEMGTVGRLGSPTGATDEVPVESLLVSRNLGALYRSFLNIQP